MNRLGRMLMMCSGAILIAFCGVAACGEDSPVVEANADPSAPGAPQIFYEKCDNPIVEGSTVTWWYAKHEFPGMKAIDIATRLTVINPFPSTFYQPIREAGALVMRDPKADEWLFFKDGEAVFFCFSVEYEPPADSETRTKVMVFR